MQIKQHDYVINYTWYTKVYCETFKICNNHIGGINMEL